MPSCVVMICSPGLTWSPICSGLSLPLGSFTNAEPQRPETVPEGDLERMGMADPVCDVIGHECNPTQPPPNIYFPPDQVECITPQCRLEPNKASAICDRCHITNAQIAQIKGN